MPKVKTERKFRNHKNEATTKGAVQKQFVVNEPVYGQLLARNEKGELIPATLNKEKVTGNRPIL